MSVMQEIKTRIGAMAEGEILMPSDLSDLAAGTTVRKCLGRCVDAGLIRRVFDGVYEKPRFSSLLQENVPTDPEKVAYALAKAYRWTVAPCGDIALNKLGLTTQVPSVWCYVSDGPYRRFEWDHVQLQFKHKTNREISQMSKQSMLVAEALRALGKERIDTTVTEQLRLTLSKTDKENLFRETSGCSEWIRETVRKVCAE